MAEPLQPSLHAIQSFAATAKRLSFTEAARDLSVSQGAVSRIVRQLEHDLGMQLFDRSGRTLQLTARGAAYYQQIRTAFDRISSATRALQDASGDAVLEIAAQPTFLLKYLMPRLPLFNEMHPDILVDVRAKDEQPNFASEAYDIFICFGSGKWNDAQAIRIMPEYLGVYASPNLLKSHDTPAGIEALRKLPLLVHSTRPHAWESLFTKLGLAPLDVSLSPRFEHFFLIAEAAAAGFGVGLLPTYSAEPDVMAGRLVRVVDDHYKSDGDYYLTHAPGARSLRKIRLFTDWLRHNAGYD